MSRNRLQAIKQRIGPLLKHDGGDGDVRRQSGACVVVLTESELQCFQIFHFVDGTILWYYQLMKKRHRVTLAKIFARPVIGTIHWSDIESLFIALGAEVSEREGSRVGVFLFGEVRVFHRPHPSPNTDKGAVVSIKKWLEDHGVRP